MATDETRKTKRVSPKQLAANRANAQKSTGPRTSEGKARVAANALKHGLTSRGIVLPPDMRIDYEEEQRAWRAQYRCEDGSHPAVALLADRAALMAVKLRRAIVLHEQRSADALDRAAADLDLDLRREHADRIRLLDRHPARTVPEMEATAEGCDWLIEQWRLLLLRLEDPRDGWTLADLKRVILLDGQSADPVHFTRRTYLVAHWFLAAGGRLPEDDQDEPPVPAWIDPRIRQAMERALARIRKRQDETPDDAPSPEEARQSLRALAHAQIRRLESLRQRAREAHDARRRDRELSALLGLDDDALRLRRYENAASLELTRCLRELDRLASPPPSRTRAERTPQPEPPPATPAPTTPSPAAPAPTSTDIPALTASVAQAPTTPAAPAPTASAASRRARRAAPASLILLAMVLTPAFLAPRAGYKTNPSDALPAAQQPEKASRERTQPAQTNFERPPQAREPLTPRPGRTPGPP